MEGIMQFRERVIAIRTDNPDAWISASLDLNKAYTDEKKKRVADGLICEVTYWPRGITGGATSKVEGLGATFGAALDSALAQAEAAEADYQKTRIGDLAEAIIRLAFRLGDMPTESALRGEGFDQAELDALGGQAVDQANDMAAGAPFAILPDATAGNEPTDGIPEEPD